jgi:hypothetical protein
MRSSPLLLLFGLATTTCAQDKAPPFDATGQTLDAGASAQADAKYDGDAPTVAADKALDSLEFDVEPGPSWCACPWAYVNAPSSDAGGTTCDDACTTGGSSPSQACGKDLICKSGEFCHHSSGGVPIPCSQTATCSESYELPYGGCHCEHDSCRPMPANCSDCSCFAKVEPPWSELQNCQVDSNGAVNVYLSSD